jgi:hypothetical protein
MAFDSWNKVLVCDDHIENIMVGSAAVGYEFKLQYPSYRGTFLSCIENLEVIVDGEKVNPCEINFVINGKELLLSEFPELFREYWFTLDKAEVRVFKAGGFEKCSSHKVCVNLRHRIPYTGYFGSYMVLDCVCEKELLVG